MLDAISAGLIRKEKRGVLVAVDTLQVNNELPTLSSEPVSEPAVATEKPVAKKRGKKVADAV
jgi:hypothetical protein